MPMIPNSRLNSKPDLKLAPLICASRERVAAFRALISPDFHPSLANPHIKATKRIHCRASDGLAVSYVKSRAMLTADDIESDLPPPFKWEIQMCTAILYGVNVRVDAEDENGAAGDRKGAMLAIGNGIKGANIHIIRHIFGAPAF